MSAWITQNARPSHVTSQDMAHRWLLVVLATLTSLSMAAACGGVVSSPGSSIDGSAGEPDATGSDAAPGDATTRGDAAQDATNASDASGDAGALTPCMVSRDVFYVDVTGPQGPIQLGGQTYTNLDTNWDVLLDPELDVMVDTGEGPAGSVEVHTPNGMPLSPGVYPQGPNAGGPWIELAVGDEGCAVTSGTMTIDDLTYDAAEGGASPTVDSLAMSFDLVCGGNSVVGCVRYSPANGPPDGGPPIADAASDAPAPLVPCLGQSYLMYVNGPNGPQWISGAEGTWSAGLTSGTILSVKIDADNSWGVTAGSDSANGSFIEAGSTYTSNPGNNFPYIQALVDGGGCQQLPQGSFTIVDLTDTGGDQAIVKQVLLWFDVTCLDAGVSGCLAYGM